MWMIIFKTLTKDKCEKLVMSMGNAEYKGNTYQTFVVKLRAFLTFGFSNNYLEKLDVKIPNIVKE